MSKWHGVIGYELSSEIRPGVWTEGITEHEYSGDLTRIYRRLQNDQKVNSDVTLANELQVVADPFAWSNYLSIRYATVLGAPWIVTSVEVQYPRLILTLGGVWNGPRPQTGAS